MDLIDVMRPFFDFLVKFFSVEVLLGGFSFSVGAFFIFMFICIIVIGFLKGLAS